MSSARASARSIPATPDCGMAEDIFAVTVAALTGPQAAAVTVARKAAARVREGQGQRDRLS